MSVIYLNKILTEGCYKLIRGISIPIVDKCFHPIILNSEQVPFDDPVVFAPNHRSTLDPFIISTSVKKPIHWEALKRFFDAKDSIFNNSKNVVLRYTTAVMFRMIGAVPLERKQDLPKDGDNAQRIANNLKSIEKINQYLQLGGAAGIFPEGTTNKNPEEKNLGSMEPTLIKSAKDKEAWLQPVAIVWIKNPNIKNKVIVNFLQAYKVNSELSVKQALREYIEILNSGIEENKKIINSLCEIEQTMNVPHQKVKSICLHRK